MRPLFYVLILHSVQLLSHPLDLAMLKVSREAGKVSAELQINPDVMAGLVGIDPAQIRATTPASQADAWARATLMSGELRSGEAPCQWGRADGRLEEVNAVVNAVAICPESRGALEWDFPFLKSPRLLPTFQLMVRGLASQGERVEVLTAAQTRLSWNLGSTGGLGAYIWMGIDHIGATPHQWYSDGQWHFPEGIDHILFVLALVLGGGSLWALVGTATGFTLGHSVTLALASFGLVHLPSRWVESAIAFSIAYMALESLFKRGTRQRWRIATLFGLIHGLGFASAVSELELSGTELLKALVGFNVGVELGQALIVVISAPLIAWAVSFPQGRRYAVPAFSAFIFVMGSVWFVQRSLGI